MPRKRRGESDGESDRTTAALDRIARLLGLLAVKGVEEKTAQVALLRSAGFEVADVAAMLGMTENHVRVASHMGRKSERKRRKRKAAKAR